MNGILRRLIHWFVLMRRIDWGVLLWVVGLHAGCFGALYYTTWQGPVAFLTLTVLTGHVGICLGYHRGFTHKSFQVVRPLRWALAVLGTWAGQGSVIEWKTNHLRHHQFSDRPGDPHSPKDSFWWGHMLWFLLRKKAKEKKALQERYASDLLRDPVLRFLHHAFLPLNILLGIILVAGGYYWGDLTIALSLLFWGMCVRIVFVFHSTWLVNSATHRWGYRSYETNDNSRNFWPVALLTGGEGWHNNHHAVPRAANQGRFWWELDLVYWCILGLELIGLATHVRREKPPLHQ